MLMFVHFKYHQVVQMCFHLCHSRGNTFNLLDILVLEDTFLSCVFPEDLVGDQMYVLWLSHLFCWYILNSREIEFVPF